MLDLVITDALVVDGTGNPGFPGSVGIEGDRVAWIGQGTTPPPDSGRTIEAKGRALAPGFVDVHTHSDLSPFVDPWMQSSLRQGVTSVVVGNCGSSPWPPAGTPDCVAMAGGPPDAMRFTSFGDYLQALEETRPAVNIGALVGHGAVRQEAMELERRQPDRAELSTMGALTAEAMADGALGLSTGLIYVPGMYATTEEVTALAREVATSGGIYTSHIRGEGEHLFTALEEAIAIGRAARVPTHISHLKCESDLVWGRAHDLLERVHTAEDVTGDQYPYAAWSSVLWSLLPEWAPLADVEAMLEHAATRRRLITAIEHGEGEAFQSSVKGVGWDRIVLENSGDGRWNGRSIEVIGAELGMAPVEACLRLVLEDPDTSCTGHAMHEDDVRAILADPEIMVASDGVAMAPDGPLGTSSVHPRNYGTFPRVVGRYVRDGVLTLEAAIRSMTSLPATRFGLRDRGRIGVGRYADLVLFDALGVNDEATFSGGHAYATGVVVVLVNGDVAWNGALGRRAGRVLRRA
jgi:N-acyl-D-amino-acid deacylase